MSKTRVVVTGVHGRMGSALARLLRDSSELTLAGATERAGVTAVQDAAALGVPVLEDLESAVRQARGGQAQVVIDFTSPQASVAHARLCAERGVALVIGSTGMTAEDKAAVAQAAQRVPIVLAPNMSVGVNLILKVAAQLAKVLGETFDVEIVETHHRMKKDAPSGTALRLAEEIAQALGRGEKDIRTARSGQVGERPPKEIGVQALRGGDVVGEHTVYFLGEGERVELTHRATNRETFAAGALRAAAWVVGQSPGLYDMQDVLGL